MAVTRNVAVLSVDFICALTRNSAWLLKQRKHILPGYSAYARMAACDNAETEDAEGDRLQFTAVISKLHDLIACCMRGKSYALCVCLVLQYLL